MRPVCAGLLLVGALVVTGCDEADVFSPTPLRPPTSIETGITRRPRHTWTVFSLYPIGTLEDWRSRCHAVGGIYFGTLESSGGALYFRVCRLWGEYRVWPGGEQWAEFLAYWDFDGQLETD